MRNAMQRLSMVAALAGWLLPAAAGAQVTGCPRHTELLGLPDGVAYQEFGVSGEFTTAWRVTYDHSDGRGLTLTGAHFRPGPEAEWVKLLDRAGLSDILIAEAGRTWDLAAGGFTLVPLTRGQVGPCARIVGDGYVAREVRDAGVLWLTAGGQGARDTRLVLWSGLRVAGHGYVVSYGFGADGTVEFRLADVGQGRPAKDGAALAQDAIWRVDVDLGGADGDSAFFTRLVSPEGSATPAYEVVPVGDGTEGGVDWVGEAFVALRVVDAELANAAGAPTGLDFRPLQRGLSRPADGAATHDFWVTAAKPDELWAAALPSYVDGESIDGADIAVWVKTAILSEARAEDGRCAGPDQACATGVWEGASPVSWSGFDLRPRNLFAGTPFYR
jgi:hypothetical protein